MANLAIKGHETRGNEVIEILEMLGGKNLLRYVGDDDDAAYSIEGQEIVLYELECIKSDGFIVFTLEEFLEKFPYKVGDKVSSKYLKNYEISMMRWDNLQNKVGYKLKGMGWYNANELQPYKEETMEEKLGQIIFDMPDGYEFFGINDDNKIVLTKKQYKYPKTYKECCDVLGLSTMDNDAQGYKADLIIRFQELLIARDVYWKIAGKEMGMDKPWEPDWNNSSQFKDVIICRSNNIIKYAYAALNTILAFPTEEMRDAFYENFKDLIEECKEFL